MQRSPRPKAIGVLFGFFGIVVRAGTGTSIADLVKITTFGVRAEDLPAAGKAHTKHFGAARPTSITIIVSALIVLSLLIEMEAVAAAKA